MREWSVTFISAVVDLHSKILDMSLPSRSNFLHVHAVLSKNLAEQKYFWVGCILTAAVTATRCQYRKWQWRQTPSRGRPPSRRSSPPTPGRQTSHPLETDPRLEADSPPLQRQTPCEQNDWHKLLKTLTSPTVGNNRLVPPPSPLCRIGAPSGKCRIRPSTLSAKPTIISCTKRAKQYLVMI